MPLTFGEARRLLSRYVGVGGKCASSDDTKLFVRKVLQHLLISGSYGNLRKFEFFATKGFFTAPYELETPLKVKINCKVGTVWDKWFEWHSTQSNLDGCIPASNALYEEPNYYPTVYDVPIGGSRIGVMALCNEAEDAHLIVQGTDTCGKEVVTFHDGVQYVGEYLRVKKGELRYTQTTFKNISNVTKTQTNGYVQLFWVKPEKNCKGYLSEYSPLEEIPSYRRFKLTTPDCGLVARVTLIGRIRLKPDYADNDIIPVDNLNALELAGGSMNANFNNDVNTGSAKDQQMQDVVSRENEYKRVENGQPVEVFFPLSAGSIVNIVS